MTTPAKARRRWWPWLLLMFSVVVLTIWTLPATLVYRLIADQLAEVEAGGISGTLWDGQASSLLLRGKDWGKLNWQLRPLPLVSGRAEADLQLDGPGVQLRGSVVRAANRALDLGHTEGTIDAAWLGPALGLPLLVPTGNVDLDLQRVSIDAEGRPTAVQGKARWVNAGLTGIVRARAGTVLIEARGENSQIDGSLRNEGDGNLGIDGAFSMRGTSYQAQVILRPDPNDAELIQALQWVGQPLDQQGGRLLLIEGEVHGWANSSANTPD